MKVILGFVMAFLLLGCEVKIESKSSSTPEPTRLICCDVERDFQQRHAVDDRGELMQCDGWCHWCGVDISVNGYKTFTHHCHQGQCGFILPNNTRCICMRTVVSVVAEAEGKK